jgi:IS1 family transposase
MTPDAALGHLARALPNFKHSVAPAKADDVLELDEIHRFVYCKKQKRWLWIALCRRTRQVVVFALGDRSEATCRSLFKRIPAGYRRSASYSDFWSAYAKVFQKGRHQSVGKPSVICTASL